MPARPRPLMDRTKLGALNEAPLTGTGGSTTPSVAMATTAATSRASTRKAGESGVGILTEAIYSHRIAPPQRVRLSPTHVSTVRFEPPGKARAGFQHPALKPPFPA